MRLLTHTLTRALRLAIATGALAAPLSVFAADSASDADRAPRQLDEIIVPGEITYRDRLDTTAPVLSYDLSYFQRFEPLTVGDMLKRVPSVAFVSDVLEYDGVRLRGLDPAYTQILINGKKVPGAGNDRSFFVDRIPAELVERIEIVRNPSANRSGDAVAGAINIVLREAMAFEGAYLRAGALHFDDGELKGTGGAVWSGAVGEASRLLVGVNAQGRYNPKRKRSDRFEEPGGDFDNREDQDDTRDGTDYSTNVSFSSELTDTTLLELTALGVRTDRTETERSLEYNVPAGTSRNNLLSENDQFEDIEQNNRAFGAELSFFAFGGDNSLSADLSRFDDETVNTEIETGYDDDETPPEFDETEGERTLSDTEDEERSFSFAHERVLESLTWSAGVDVRYKDRDFSQAVAEVDSDDEGAPLPPFTDFERSNSRIEERRVDPWLMFNGKGENLAWEVGARYEDTTSDVRFDGTTTDNDYDVFLPSAHLKWDLSDTLRLGASAGRTLRRPDFNLLLPQTLEEEFGDNDFVGNPLLQPERAVGFDLGLERRIGSSGVIGINVFFRDVSDLIELVNTGDPSATAIADFEDAVEEFLDENPGATPNTPGYPQFDPDSFVYSAANVGDGEVWGVELDLSTPLAVVNLPDTGVFLNASWLDSEVEDAFGERRFNNQARYVYNFGFIHDFSASGWSFGASYRRQGRAESRVLAEEVETRYGADLEAFVEKRFGDRLAVRLTGSNLLDASKDETFRKFDNAADQGDRDYDEFELETEQSGPAFQLIARYSFGGAQ